MNFLKKYIIIAVLIGGITINLWGYYFNDNFANMNNWTNIKYGFTLGVWTGGQATTYSVTGNKLRFYSTSLNMSPISFGTEHAGYSVIQTNFKTNASVYQPYGFEFTRHSLQLDSHYEWNLESGRMRALFNIYLLESGTLSAVGDKLSNLVVISEVYRPQLDMDPDTQPFSFMTWNEMLVTNGVKMILSPLYDNAGNSTTGVDTMMEYCYDNQWGKNTDETTLGTSHNYTNNSNVVKYRVVSDGEKVYLYLNPNPNGVAQRTRTGGSITPPNAFYLVDTYSIPLTNNLTAMFSIAMNRWDTEALDLTLSNFTIRSICSNLTTEIMPYQSRAGAVIPLYIAIKPEFSTNQEAGVGEIYVDIPEGYGWTNMTNSLSVHYVSSSGVFVKDFSKINGDSNPASGSVAVSIKDMETLNDKRRLKIRFNLGAASTDVFHPDNGCGNTVTNAILLIVSNFQTSTTPDASGKSFNIYINNEKYNDTAWTKVATVGKMRSTVGNAYNMASLTNLGEDNTATLKTYINQSAIAGITGKGNEAIFANDIYEGDGGKFFYNIKSVGLNTANISEVRIDIPEGFWVDPTSFESDQIGSVIITNNNQIVVYYTNTPLIGGSGFDTIGFSTVNTPLLGTTNETNVYWTSKAYSLLSGTTENTTIISNIDIMYQSQIIRVKKEKPKGEANILPAFVSNTLVSNRYQVGIINKATKEGNDIRKLLIRVSEEITNVQDVSSGYPSTVKITNTNGYLYIEVDYSASATNLPYGRADTITFTGWDNIPALTNLITASNTVVWADNGNGDGWVGMNEEATIGLKFRFYTPPANIVGKISFPLEEDGSVGIYRHHYYSDLESATNILIYFKNQGEEGNEIYKVQIYCPNDYTNIIPSPNSTRLASVTKLAGVLGTNIEGGVTNIYSNVIEIDYTMGPLYFKLEPGQEDYVNLSVKDAIIAPKEVAFKVYAKNTTNYAQGFNASPDNLTMTYIEPPVYADTYVTVPNGYIDASTNQYTISYTIRNLGRVSNRINKVWVVVPTNYISNVVLVSNYLGNDLSYSYASGGVILIDYTTLNNFVGGTNDTVVFTVYPDVSSEVHFDIEASITNNRMLTNNISVRSGYTKTVDITQPPTLFAYNITPTVLFTVTNLAVFHTNAVVMNISNSGWGNNFITNVRIDIPAIFSGKVIAVSNARNSWTHEDSEIDLSAGSITIRYGASGTNLPAGAVDSYYLTLEVSTNLVTNTHWNILALNNYSDNVMTNTKRMLTNIAGGATNATNMLSLVNQPYAYLLPNVVYSSSLVNHYTNIIFNGDSAAGRNIKKIRIGLAGGVFNLFTTISNINTSITAERITNYLDGNGTNYIEVWYNVGLSPASFEKITYFAYDNWSAGDHSTEIEVFVDYGDGSSWHNTTGQLGQTKILTFTNEMVDAQTYVAPTEIPQDYPSYEYQFYIKNMAQAGNDVQIVKIIPPVFITNITGVSASPIAADFITNSNNVVILYFTNNSIGSGETNMITLTAYDNIDTTTASSYWSVKVDNTPNGSGERDAVSIGADGLKIAVVQPDYRPRVYVEATNSISSLEKNKVYSVDTTNYIKFFVFNQSVSGNNLTKFRIQIPAIGTVINTNTLNITNLLKSNATTYISNDFIYVEYGSDVIVPAQRDEILLSYVDLITHTETEITWNSEAAFNTTYNLYKPTGLYSADKSVNIAYVMPDAMADITMGPNEIYYTMDEMTLNYRISNTGWGTGDIDWAAVYLPTDLVTGFSLGKVSNSVATNITYSVTNGMLKVEFFYSNLPPKSNDNIYFYLDNSATTTKTVTVESSVRNHLKTNQTSGNKNLFMTTVPSFYVTPNTIDSSTMTNRFSIRVDNSINGSSTIKKLVFNFPVQFTNISGISSEVLANPNSVLTNVTSLTLDYVSFESKAIASGDNDWIEFTLWDNYDIGNLATVVDAWVSDGQTYVPIRLADAKSRNLNFVMPSVSSYVKITPDNIYINTFTNSLEINLANTGEGSNKISFARVKLPTKLTNIANYQSSQGATVSYLAESNVLLVDYTGDLLDVGEFDLITFDFSNTANGVTNLPILVEAANLTNNPVYYVSPGPRGNQQIFAVTHPPIGVEAAFYGESKLYLIETNSVLTYRVVNRSFGTQLTQLTITLSTNVFESIELYDASEKAVEILFHVESNTFVVSYPEDNSFGYMAYDDLQFTIRYKLSNATKINLETRFWVYGDTNAEYEKAYTVGDSVSFITVTNSTWGNLTGTVFPKLRTVGVKLYHIDSVIPATNINGDTLSGASITGSGFFEIKRIPSGDYRVEFSSPFYRTTNVNMSIRANTIEVMGEMQLRNAPLVLGNSNQVIYCYENTNTSMVLPPNSVNSEFSINIKSYFLTTLQKQELSTNKTVKAPVTTDNMKGYRFEMNDYNDKTIDGSILNLDATLNIAYDRTDVLARGWNEDDLAIYYWDDNGRNGRWIKIGGTLNKDKRVLTAKVSYVHQYYAIMSSVASEGGVIKNVAARPKVFTPNRTEAGYFNNIRITFELDSSVATEGFEVKIYDLKGKLLKSFKRSGAYSQGEVAWDGKDDEGFPVKSGVYVYRVIAGGQIYSGTVVIAR